MIFSSKKTLNREKKGLLLASKKTGCEDLTLITYHDDYEIVEKGKTIKVVPAYQWLVEE